MKMNGMTNHAMLLPGRPEAARRGSALIIAILLIMVLTVLGLGLVTVAELEREIAMNDQRAALAREIARSALAYGRVTLLNNADIFALDEGPWDDDLRGAPLSAAAGQVPVGWQCINPTGLAENECRDCLRTTTETTGVDGACVGKIKAMPLYDYRFPSGTGRYLIQQPVLNAPGSFQAPGMGGGSGGTNIKGYYTLWIRDNPSDFKTSPVESGDKQVVLIAEVWVKKYDDLLQNYWNNPAVTVAGTPENPIVARTVYAEVILQGDPEHSAYITGAGGIDQHNTNTIYVKE